MEDLPARLAGPKVAKTRMLAPTVLWGLTLGEPDGSGLGVAIRTVRLSSPAEAAGIKAGDVLTTLDGRWTTTVADAYAAAHGVLRGQSAEAVVLRDAKELRFQVRPVDGI